MEEILKKIFEENNLKLVDCQEYYGESFEVPEDIEVSYRWLARKVNKELSADNKDYTK